MSSTSNDLVEQVGYDNAQPITSDQPASNSQATTLQELDLDKETEAILAEELARFQAEEDRLTAELLASERLAQRLQDGYEPDMDSELEDFKGGEKRPMLDRPSPFSNAGSSDNMSRSGSHHRKNHRAGVREQGRRERRAARADGVHTPDTPGTPISETEWMNPDRRSYREDSQPGAAPENRDSLTQSEGMMDKDVYDTGDETQGNFEGHEPVVEADRFADHETEKLQGGLEGLETTVEADNHDEYKQDNHQADFEGLQPAVEADDFDDYEPENHNDIKFPTEEDHNVEAETEASLEASPLPESELLVRQEPEEYRASPESQEHEGYRTYRGHQQLPEDQEIPEDQEYPDDQVYPEQQEYPEQHEYPEQQEYPQQQEYSQQGYEELDGEPREPEEAENAMEQMDATNQVSAHQEEAYGGGQETEHMETGVGQMDAPNMEIPHSEGPDSRGQVPEEMGHGTEQMDAANLELAQQEESDREARLAAEEMEQAMEKMNAMNLLVEQQNEMIKQIEDEVHEDEGPSYDSGAYEDEYEDVEKPERLNTRSFQERAEPVREDSRQQTTERPSRQFPAQERTRSSAPPSEGSDAGTSFSSPQQRREHEIKLLRLKRPEVLAGGNKPINVHASKHEIKITGLQRPIARK